MPRPPDPDVEDRILNAAQKLWNKGAEKALTMRAVAQAAGTNTPAVYRRFANRQEILRVLLLRIQQEVVDLLKFSRSPEDVCERYLDFALSHPHEYELFHIHAREYGVFRVQPDRTPTGGEPRPGIEVMKKKLAEWLGGSPEEHVALTLALWSLAHGTAMLIISKTVPAEHVTHMRSIFTASVKTLIGGAASISLQK